LPQSCFRCGDIPSEESLVTLPIVSARAELVIDVAPAQRTVNAWCCFGQKTGIPGILRVIEMRGVFSGYGDRRNVRQKKTLSHRQPQVNPTKYNLDPASNRASQGSPVEDLDLREVQHGGTKRAVGRSAGGVLPAVPERNGHNRRGG
jgi:hypothetical protein